MTDVYLIQTGPYEISEAADPGVGRYPCTEDVVRRLRKLNRAGQGHTVRLDAAGALVDRTGAEIALADADIAIQRTAAAGAAAARKVARRMVRSRRRAARRAEDAAYAAAELRMTGRVLGPAVKAELERIASQ